MRRRRNPYRVIAGKETKTWLPDDAGKVHGDLKWIPAKHGGSPYLLLPTGDEIELVELGKGQFTTAYLGADQWVYLLTIQEGLRDHAKDAMVDMTRMYGTDPEAIHFPWVESIGDVNKKGVWYTVYREPLYEKIPAGSPNAKLASALKKVAEEGRQLVLRAARDPRTSHRSRDYEKNAQVDAILASPKVPDSLKQAVQVMADYIANYGDGWLFEFPIRNLVQDADGNLVLLDVIFDADALMQQRMAKAKQQRGW